MLVDDRKNFFMMGVALSLTSHFPNRPLWMIFVLLSVMFGFAYFSKKSSQLGAGDIHCLAWIFLGLAIINLVYLLVFIAFFIPVVLLFGLAQAKLAGKDRPLPFFGVILISFVAFCLLWGLF